MEAALSQRQYDLAKANILPALTVSAGYSARDKYAASASTTFTNDEPDALPASPAYSVSQDKNRSTASATFTWNILDFGLSYVRAGQSADRRMIAIERQRNSKQHDKDSFHDIEVLHGVVSLRQRTEKPPRWLPFSRLTPVPPPLSLRSQAPAPNAEADQKKP